MNQLPILIKREFWEHRNTFLMLPLITTGFFLLMMLFVFMAASTSLVNTIDIDNDEDQEWIQEDFSTDDVFERILLRLDSVAIEDRVQFMHAGLSSMSAPLLIILWFVMFFYLLNSLYEDRKDRSILFWKSLPVSDVMTILSKLGVALIAVPLVYLAGIALLQFSGLILLSLAAMGSDVAVWDTVWGPSNLLSEWFGYVGIMLFYSVWALPFYGWLLAVSAYVKSVPLVWALGVPFAFTIVERIFTGQSGLSRWIGQHTVPVSFIGENQSISETIQAQLFTLNMLSAIVVGAALVALAIWLRGKADEI